VRISFKKIKIEDCDFILKIRNDDSTRRFLHDSQKFSKDEFKNWFESKSPDWLKILHNDEEVGYIRTVSSYPSIEIGMDISPNHRGKGYAKAAYRKLLESLTFKMYHKATLRVLKSNFVALSLYEKLGFKIKEETDNDLYMELELNTLKGKAAKVICTWYGPRRGNFAGKKWAAEDNLEMLKYWWNKEKEIDYGHPTDIILVNNIYPQDKQCGDFIHSLKNEITKNGRIRIFSRENIGASFGAFDFAFNKFENEYDYWFFIEDDQIILKNKILSNAMDLMSSIDNKIGFYGVVGCQKTHCNGGCGITTRSILKAIKNLNYSEELSRSCLPFHFDRGVDLGHEKKGEIPFTNLIKKKLGLDFYCPKEEAIVLSWKQNKHRGIEFPQRVLLHDQRP